MELDDSPMSCWCLETARLIAKGEKLDKDILATLEDWLPEREKGGRILFGKVSL